MCYLLHCFIVNRLSIVESIPENLTYPAGSPSHTSTYDSWMWLLQEANSSIDVGSYYWTLRGFDDVTDPSDAEVHVYNNREEYINNNNDNNNNIIVTEASFL